MAMDSEDEFGIILFGILAIVLGSITWAGNMAKCAQERTKQEEIKLQREMMKAEMTNPPSSTENP